MNRVTRVVEPEPGLWRARVGAGPLVRLRQVAIGITIVVSIAISRAVQAQISDFGIPPENRIVPHVGLGKLKLGMSQEEVVAILGRPSRVVIHPHDQSAALYVSKASAAVLVIDYEQGKAVEFEFTSSRFRTDDGDGTGTPWPSRPGQRPSEYRDDPVAGGGLSFRRLHPGADLSDEIVVGKVYAGDKPLHNSIEGFLTHRVAEVVRWKSARLMSEAETLFFLVPFDTVSLYDSLTDARKGWLAGYRVFSADDKRHAVLQIGVDFYPDQDFAEPVIKDFSGDGYPDFMVQRDQGVRGQYSQFSVYVYDPEKKTFSEAASGYDPKFNSTKRILTFISCSDCEKAYIVTYGRRNGKLVKIGERIAK